MDAFFESPKHGSNSNGSNNPNQSQLNESIVNENSNSLKQETIVMSGEQISANQVVINQPMDHSHNQTNGTLQFAENNSDQSMEINHMASNMILSENNDLGSLQNAGDMQQQTQSLQLNDLHSGEGMGQQVKIEMENGQVVVVDSSQIENVTLVQQSQQLQHNFNEQSNQFGQQQQVGVSLSNQLVVNSNGTVSNMVDSSMIGNLFACI
jgi:hypothetical protein